MNFREHLFVGWCFSFFAIIILNMLDYNVFDARIIPYIIIGVSVFSELPDIDHSRSKASRLLSVGLLLLTVYSLFLYYQSGNELDLFESMVWVVIFIIHRNYALSSKKHRRFPHTFTFGVLASSAVFFISGSAIVSVLCFVSFFSHLVADTHVTQALKKDKRIFKKILH